MTRTLYRNAVLYGGGSALLVDDGRVTWRGWGEPAADQPAADQIVDVGGAWLAPAFVDAHVHATATGLALGGLDLAGSGSLVAALDALAWHALAQPDGVLLGSGWDESAWPERRAPASADLDRAAPGRAVYLARVDAHSAVASPALLAQVPSVAGLPGWDGVGRVCLDAHHAVRRAALASLSPAQRRAAQRSTRTRAATLGVGCLHEMGGPDIAGEDDFTDLLALARSEPGPEVIGYWGEWLAMTKAAALGAVGAGGDLFVDGSLGSRTAALSSPYAGDPHTCGHVYLDASQVAEHVVGCIRAGLQSGFHAIGDAAVAAVVDGFAAAADAVGATRLTAGRHRVEHAELCAPDAVAALARFGVVASVQPAFDAAWGGEDGMYVERLGSLRARAMNPFAAFATAGVALTLGSDAPVTPLDPWGGVRAAVHHRTPGSGLSPATAFAAHTRGGWYAAGGDKRAGTLLAGAPATLAVWAVPALGPSTGLPDLDAPDPVCLRTVVHGVTVHDTGVLG